MPYKSGFVRVKAKKLQYFQHEFTRILNCVLPKMFVNVMQFLLQTFNIGVAKVRIGFPRKAGTKAKDRSITLQKSKLCFNILRLQNLDYHRTCNISTNFHPTPFLFKRVCGQVDPIGVHCSDPVFRGGEGVKLIYEIRSFNV